MLPAPPDPPDPPAVRPVSPLTMEHRRDPPALVVFHKGPTGGGSATLAGVTKILRESPRGARERCLPSGMQGGPRSRASQPNPFVGRVSSLAHWEAGQHQRDPRRWMLQTPHPPKPPSPVRPGESSDHGTPRDCGACGFHKDRWRECHPGGFYESSEVATGARERCLPGVREAPLSPASQHQRPFWGPGVSRMGTFSGPASPIQQMKHKELCAGGPVLWNIYGDVFSSSCQQSPRLTLRGLYSLLSYRKHDSGRDG
ncbi:hypothetical protein GWK47_027919 [Chionoecetes opilio]|uniref:Uncharacterized protein n=1 Tax=Chionoecetes opilio TaxID=41210 RepID=A0A8J5D6A7_CHIOP|nr:hypothetical protein GWK47_027919 [Chionoecetes opilio]